MNKEYTSDFDDFDGKCLNSECGNSVVLVVSRKGCIEFNEEVSFTPVMVVRNVYKCGKCGNIFIIFKDMDGVLEDCVNRMRKIYRK